LLHPWKGPYAASIIYIGTVCCRRPAISAFRVSGSQNNVRFSKTSSEYLCYCFILRICKRCTGVSLFFIVSPLQPPYNVLGTLCKITVNIVMNLQVRSGGCSHRLRCVIFRRSKMANWRLQPTEYIMVVT